MCSLSLVCLRQDIKSHVETFDGGCTEMGLIPCHAQSDTQRNMVVTEDRRCFVILRSKMGLYQDDLPHVRVINSSHSGFSS